VRERPVLWPLQAEASQIHGFYNRLIFAGDVMLSRAVRREILGSKDSAHPFRKIAPLMSGADIAFVNLESPFSDEGAFREGGLVFHAAPEMIAGLQLAGVDVASTANNHARDCGPHGVDYTHGIRAVGSAATEKAAHEGTVIARNGIRFGFVGYTFDQKNGNWKDTDPRIADADPVVMARDVEALAKRCDVVIVSMHHGIEYQPRPSAAQIAFAHAAIDAGAKLVIGHHPHVIQTVEKYREGLIYYSLGNFVFDQYQRKETQHGQVVQVSFLGREILNTHEMNVQITPSGPELEGLSAAGRPLDVPSELISHRR
jgi:poly-gamma-glutamate synthesis protein (capsule biosynthesis protein)